MAPPGSVINISGTTPVDDPEYRYKMPVVYGKVEGRGNGIKTVIPNISEVALALHRPPGEVNKFFGCELGAQTTYNTDTDRAVVNGSHSDKVLQDMIHRYIEVFVICPNCGLPETDYKIKNGLIHHKCAACGAKEMVDMQHKLCTYILAQNKKAKADAKKADKKKGKDKDKDKDGDKEEKKKKKKKDKKDDSGSDEDKKKKKKDKKKDKKDKKKDKKESGDGGDYIKDAIMGKKSEDIEVDDVSHDGSEGEVDDESALGLAVEATRKFLLDNPNADDNEIAEVVTNQQMASALKSHDKVHIICQAAFTPKFFKNKEIEKYSGAISKITAGNPIMERHLIAALEGLCVEKPKNFAVMLKQMFDEDALEEEVIIEWADEGRNVYTLASVDEETRAMLRSEAEPVVVWLMEADSDDDSDSDSD
mmetsp:Transcript_169/g.200  ORF Transcript_169/g.200 Transcript_169/m.200 type:complete len:420 (-) Transcript_169:191-1450(-)|eukprot:CAMPEP_0195283694 /NCGR_PEP_ID=MMETSP0707-20130614/2154_1 /TAXON_ID=33640 /ORGANISM="Asterionellopsis glacialis, Strain CCMP134" /LENGTH=419 /DNA_ID=CAMNT_0040342911 /DNA_START=358 /DNA_END=1617 /DNA_ORIENTATION=+